MEINGISVVRAGIEHTFLPFLRRHINHTDTIRLPTYICKRGISTWAGDTNSFRSPHVIVRILLIITYLSKQHQRFYNLVGYFYIIFGNTLPLHKYIAPAQNYTIPFMDIIQRCRICGVLFICICVCLSTHTHIHPTPTPNPHSTKHKHRPLPRSCSTLHINY